MKEHNIQSLIMAEFSKYGCIAFRTNSGKAKSLDGKSFIKLLPEGFSDLIVLCPKGKILFVECKTLTGKQRECQKNFQALCESLGHIYTILRDPSEVLPFLENLRKNMHNHTH